MALQSETDNFLQKAELYDAIYHFKNYHNFGCNLNCFSKFYPDLQATGNLIEGNLRFLIKLTLMISSNI